jgi:hypothetical protein
MDFSKLDPALAGALSPPPAGPALAARRGTPQDESVESVETVESKLLVFVHVQRDEVDGRELARLGVREESIAGNVATATLSPEQIDELSEQPWVRQIRLSQPLKLLGGRKGGPPKSVI